MPQIFSFPKQLQDIVEKVHPPHDSPSKENKTCIETLNDDLGLQVCLRQDPEYPASVLPANITLSLYAGELIRRDNIPDFDKQVNDHFKNHPICHTMDNNNMYECHVSGWFYSDLNNPASFEKALRIATNKAKKILDKYEAEITNLQESLYQQELNK